MGPASSAMAVYICRNGEMYICTNPQMYSARSLAPGSSVGRTREDATPGAREKTPRRGFLNAFVDVGAVDGQTSRPAACRVDRPDLIERGPSVLVPGGLLRLALLRVRYFEQVG